jgi:hypothetical protein
LANAAPKITFVIGTRRHNKRYFRLEPNGSVVSTKPEDVVNGTVTRQDIPEFFLQSHFPLQGTAQLTQYNVLLNELKITEPRLEQFMLLLANMHQISG